MSRKLIAMLVSILAVCFAFAAMAAIRWPSIIMIVSFLNDGEVGESLAGIDWRELGLIHGGPYFLAALCLYASSAMIAQTRHGALSWYAMGCAAGFPCLYLVDFEPGWWRDPSPAEGMVAGTGMIALLLAIAVWDLRKRKPAPEPPQEEQMITVPASVLATGFIPTPEKKSPPRKPRGPQSAAVRATRAQFARDGQKMLAREKARAARRKP